MSAIDPDDAFFNRTELERVGVVGPELVLLLDWSIGSGATLLCKDKKKKRVGEDFSRGHSDA